MLEIGWKAPQSILINGVDQIKDGYSDIVLDSTGKYYRMKLRADAGNIHDEFIFSISKIKKTEKLIKGELTEINYKHYNGVRKKRKPSVIENANASGNIKLDLESNIITMKILFHNKENSETNYEIIWDHREPVYKKQFIKIGERIDYHLDNTEEFVEMGYEPDDAEHFKDHKWQFRLFPLGGLELLEKHTCAIGGAMDESIVADDENKIYIDGGYFEAQVMEEAEKHSAHNEIYLSFIAKKAGKYRLSIDNGFMECNYEIFVL